MHVRNDYAICLTLEACTHIIMEYLLLGEVLPEMFIQGSVIKNIATSKTNMEKMHKPLPPDKSILSI